MAGSAAPHRNPAPPRIPAPFRNPAQSHPRGPVSREQIDALVSRAVAGFGVLFGLQTVPILLNQLDEVHRVWVLLFAPLFFVTLVGALVAAVLQRYVRVMHGIVAVYYVVGVLTWPIAITDVDGGTHSTHWLYPLLTVASAMAAIAFRPALATLYLVVVPIVMAVVRVVSGAVLVREAVLDSVYAIILGGAIIIIITMLRQAASAVDTAQKTALDAYAHAVRQHATEVERVQVDAIVHDSVLTTLLSAARADTPESRSLAASMAAKAIGHLRQAALVGPHDGASTPLTQVSSRVTEAAAGAGAHFEIRTRGIGSRSIPAAAADAVCSAAVQAMVNSVQHAGDAPRVKRWITVRGLQPLGIVIEVGDTGHGFAAWEVPPERIGVRVSIVERVAHAGGRAEIDSAPGEGTVVTIRWPAEAR